MCGVGLWEWQGDFRKLTKYDILLIVSRGFFKWVGGVEGGRTSRSHLPAAAVRYGFPMFHALISMDFSKQNETGFCLEKSIENEAWNIGKS